MASRQQAVWTQAGMNCTVRTFVLYLKFGSRINSSAKMPCLRQAAKPLYATIFQRNTKYLAYEQIINRLTHIVAHWQGTQSHLTKANLAKEPQFLQPHKHY